MLQCYTLVILHVVSILSYTQIRCGIKKKTNLKYITPEDFDLENQQLGKMTRCICLSE